MSFRVERKVLFRDCDPAGIVFYPRYFEMMNDTVEAWFDGPLATPFEEVIRTGGVPTVAVETEFRAPSRHGDRLTLTLTPTRIGGASLDLSIAAAAGAEVRFDARLTIVPLGPDFRAARWPDDLRTRIEGQMA